jgi:hypothetical protein
LLPSNTASEGSMTRVVGSSAVLCWLWRATVEL